MLSCVRMHVSVIIQSQYVRCFVVKECNITLHNISDRMITFLHPLSALWGWKQPIGLLMRANQIEQVPPGRRDETITMQDLSEPAPVSVLHGWKLEKRRAYKSC